MAWCADGIQAVLFTTPGLQHPDALKVWNWLFDGESPDNFQRGQPGPNQISNASAVRGLYNIVATSQFGRITISAHASEAPGDGPPQIKDYEAALDEVAKLTRNVVDRIESNRLGLTLNMSQLTEAEGINEQMEKLTGGIKFPPSSTDLVYQFNQKTQLDFPKSVEINRICTWLTGAHQYFTMPTFGGVPTASNMPFIAFNIDINTAGTGHFTGAIADSIMNALAVEAKTAARKGRL
jgi:hypothetical protein